MPATAILALRIAQAIVAIISISFSFRTVLSSIVLALTAEGLTEFIGSSLDFLLFCVVFLDMHN